MKVVRERPCQRRYHRVTAPMQVTLPTGRTLMATNWSIGDLRIDGVDGPLPELGTETKLVLQLPFQGFDISFEVVGRVARTEETGATICYEFVELCERGRELLSHFVEDLIRGKMATVDDTICRIDIPVTPISTQPDVNPKEGVQVRRWPIKTILMSALYLAAGIGVFSYLAILGFSSLTRLEVQAAVTSKPLYTIKMPMDGLVKPIRLVEGAALRPGDPIARVQDPRLDEQVREAEIKIAEAKAALWRAEERLRIMTRQQQLFQTISRTDKEIALARVEARREALRAADERFERVLRLHDKGLATNEKLRAAELEQQKIAASLRELELELEQAMLMHAVGARRHYNHKEFVVDLDLLEIEISELRTELNSAIARHALLEEKRSNNVIRAPAAGRIVKVHDAGQSAWFAPTRRDEPLALFEYAAEPTVTAYLRQEEVLAVGLNDTASIYLPSLGRFLDAQVVRVDRSSAYIDGGQSHYQWRSKDDRTALVVLKLRQTKGAGSADIAAGLPAVVVFKKRFSSEIYARIADPDEWI